MTASSVVAFDCHAFYRVEAQFVVRREPFGALAYDLRSKRLLVLRDQDLVTVLERLDDRLNAEDTVAAVAPARNRTLLKALAHLEREGLIRVV